MHLTVCFDNDTSRDVPVTAHSVLDIRDAVTGQQLDLFAIEGVRALYLVTDTGTGAGMDVEPAELARSIGWVPPEELQAAVDQAGAAQTRVKQLETNVAEFERLQQRWQDGQP